MNRETPLIRKPVSCGSGHLHIFDPDGKHDEIPRAGQGKVEMCVADVRLVNYCAVCGSSLRMGEN